MIAVSILAYIYLSKPVTHQPDTKTNAIWCLLLRTVSSLTHSTDTHAFCLLVIELGSRLYTIHTYIHTQTNSTIYVLCIFLFLLVFSFDHSPLRCRLPVICFSIPPLSRRQFKCTHDTHLRSHKYTRSYTYIYIYIKSKVWKFILKNEILPFLVTHWHHFFHMKLMIVYIFARIDPENTIGVATQSESDIELLMFFFWSLRLAKSCFAFTKLAQKSWSPGTHASFTVGRDVSIRKGLAWPVK